MSDVTENTWKTWSLWRLRNKPHIYREQGEWKVILREGFDFQAFIQRRFDAHWFCQDRNYVTYQQLIESKFPRGR